MFLLIDHYNHLTMLTPTLTAEIYHWECIHDIKIIDLRTLTRYYADGERSGWLPLDEGYLHEYPDLPDKEDMRDDEARRVKEFFKSQKIYKPGENHVPNHKSQRPTSTHPSSP